MKYLIIDGMLHGTGIRDGNTGGYIEPDKLELSKPLIARLGKWLLEYEDEHYNEFSNQKIVAKLDNEGQKISALIKSELIDVKVDYFSNALMVNLSI